MWLGQDALSQQELLDQWRHMAVFYIAAQGQGTARIRNLPLLNEPLVQLDLLDSDLALVGEALYRLGEVLFAAGAERLYSPIDGQPPIDRLEDMDDIRHNLKADQVSFSTIHLFSSCPMGEDQHRCVVDSYGKLHGSDNVHIHDASILPSSPGVNPQGVIMAIARRNCARLLSPAG